MVLSVRDAPSIDCCVLGGKHYEMTAATAVLSEDLTEEAKAIVCGQLTDNVSLLLGLVIDLLLVSNRINELASFLVTVASHCHIMLYKSKTLLYFWLNFRCYASISNCSNQQPLRYSQ